MNERGKKYNSYRTLKENGKCLSINAQHQICKVEMKGIFCHLWKIERNFIRLAFISRLFGSLNIHHDVML
jgi:hypothetical protein